MLSEPLWRSRVVWMSGFTALVLVSVTTFSALQIRAAADQLSEAEGDLIFARVADMVHALPTQAVTKNDLDAIVEANRDLGLLSIELGRRPPLRSSFQGVAPQTYSRALPPPRKGMERAGDARAEGFERGPPRGPPPPHARFAPDGPPPGAHRPPQLTVGYTGKTSASAQQQAIVQVLVALLAAIAIVGLGILFARADQRRHRLQSALGEQRLLASLGEMSAVLAHEIRNPLGAIKGHAQLLVEELVDAHQETTRAERLIHESTRLESIVDKLLTFVRSGELSPQWTPLAPLIRDAATRAHVAPLTFDATATEELGALVDGRSLGLALENLFENAVAAGSGAACARLEVVPEGIRLVIEDDGPGIAPSVANRLFDPFVTTKTKGVGLGLALSARIIGAHGGTLLVGRPLVLTGAAFEIVLPPQVTSNATPATPQERA